MSVIDALYFGGDEYRLLAFGSSIDKTRFDHTVLTMMGEDDSLAAQFGSLRPLYRQAGIRLLDLGEAAVSPMGRRGLGVAKKLLSLRQKVQKLAALIRDEKVDALDVHLAPANPICALAAKKTGIPFAVTLYQINQRRSAKLWLAGQFNLGCADALVTDSAAQAEVIRRWLVRDRQIHNIPNGTLPPQTAVSRQHMLKLFDIPAGRPLTIIGQVSSLVSYKGQMVLLEAAKRVLEREPNCFFLLVGYERNDPGCKGSLLRRTEALGIAEQVRIVGYAGPIGDVWSVIDIHAHASRLDSLPNALLEAMSLGKPSVVTAVGGIPEVIKHGFNGLLVPASDPQELANALLALLADDNLRSNIGREARKTYVGGFSSEIMTQRLERLFEILVDSCDRKKESTVG